MIGIQVLECVKAVCCQLAIALDGVNTKEFAARVDGVITIAIQHQPGVIRLDPAGASFHTIGIVIEQDDCAIAGAGGFDAIAIEVEHQRVEPGRRGSSQACNTSQFKQFVTNGNQGIEKIFFELTQPKIQVIRISVIRISIFQVYI